MPVDGDIILKAGLNTKPVKSALDDLHKSVNKGFKNLLRYGLGVRSLFALFRKVRRAITEGFGDLAQVSEPFNAAMSSIKNALAGLKSSFASAFAPIIEFVAPALTTFINMVAKAVDAIGMLIAALTGQKTYIKAIPAQQDYAASVDKTAKSAKSASDNLDDASDSAKKLQRQLAGFDDVEILKSPDESGSGKSGGSSGAGGSGITSVDTPLSSAFTSIADLLKKAWEDADFYDIGRIVGEKLRDALLSIPWETIKETLRKIAKSAATFLNGYFETPGLFEAIGKTIAEGINSAFEFLYTFIITFHWDSYGSAIRTRLVSTLDNIDWDLIYDTFAEFGDGFAQYLNSLFKPETFESIGETVSNLLTAAFEFLNHFGDTFNFTNFGSSIAAGINRFLLNFNVARFTSGINKFVYGFRDAVLSFLSKVNWYDFGLTVRNILVKIDWKAALSAVGKFIWEALNASVQLLRGLFDTDNIGGPIKEALESLQKTIDEAIGKIDFDTLINGFKDLVDALSPAVAGFAAGFIEVFEVLIKAGTELLNILGPVFESIATALNKMDPETLEQIGKALGNIIGSLLILKTVSTIGTTIQNLAGSVGSLFSSTASKMVTTGNDNLIKYSWSLKNLGTGFIAAIGAEREHRQEVLENADVVVDAMSVFDTMKRTLDNVKEKYGLTKSEIQDMSGAMANAVTGSVPLEEAFASIGSILEENNIPADEFYDSLVGVLDLNPANTNAQRIKEAINEIGTTSDSSKKSTTGLQGAFDAFNGLGFSVPLKMALLSGAVALLGDKGVFSKEKTKELQDVLESYDPNKPEDALNTVQKAFEATGVTAEEMTNSIMASSTTLSTDMKKEYKQVVTALKQMGIDGTKDLAAGMNSEAKEVRVASRNVVIDNLLEAIKNFLDMHSPSKKLLDVGQNAIQGLINGIKQKENLLSTTMKTMANSLIRTLEATYSQFSTIGMQIISNIFNGMNGSVSNVISLVYNMIYSIQGSFYSMDWYSIGSNIGNGIYNGLASSANRLAVLAWNVAVSMFNSARNALGIRSPSKKFAWIGEMVSTGLGEGVEDKAGLAVSKLQALLTTLENLGSATTIPMPDVAMGKIAPYSTSVTNKQDAQSLSSITDAVESMHNDALTRDDIIEIINTAMRNFTVDLYIGDEQIARHANNGNLKLSRRYGMVT